MRQKDFLFFFGSGSIHLLAVRRFLYRGNVGLFQECFEKAAYLTDRVSGLSARHVQHRMWSVAQFSKSFLSWWLHCRVSRCCREIFKVLRMAAVPPSLSTHSSQLEDSLVLPVGNHSNSRTPQPSCAVDQSPADTGFVGMFFSDPHCFLL